MADQRKTRRGGFYWRNDEPYLSVTAALKIIDKPALRYWFGQQVYWAFVKNPDFDEKQALNAPWQTSGKAKNRGTIVHDLVENYTNTGELIKNTPSEYQGYANAFADWISDYKPDIKANEMSVFNHEHRYAGTLDMIANLKSRDSGVIIDVKTGKDIYNEAWLQLSAYLHADEVEGKAKHIAVLLLQPDGTYKWQYGTDQFGIFLAAKKLYEWANATTLKNVGYIK